MSKWYRVTNIVAYQKGSWTSNGFQLSQESKIKIENESIRPFKLPKLWEKAPAITLASGEIFINSTNQREELFNTTQGNAVDMNLFGLVRVCTDQKVPLFVWRIVSDKADEQANEDFKNFVSKYDGAGGKAVSELIKLLPPNPTATSSYSYLRKMLERKK